MPVVEGNMAARSALKRKAFCIDEQSLRRARKALGVQTDADAVRASLEWVAEMEEFWHFMRRTRGKLRPGSIAEP
jgi:hypothetical protein